MYLKFFLSCLLGSCLLVTACNQQDQKLISKVEGDTQRWQSELGQYESIGAKVEQLRRDVEAASPNQATAPADPLKIATNAMVNREKAAISAYKEYVASLTTSLAAYKAGTTTKEDLELQHKAIRISLGNMGKTFDAVETEYQQRLAELAARPK